MNTLNGSESLPQSEGQPLKLRLRDLKLYSLGEGGPNARTASDEEFNSFLISRVEIGEGSKGKRWTVFRRRDILNWCIENALLSVDGTTLKWIENQQLDVV